MGKLVTDKPIESARSILTQVRQLTDRIGISYSGGKDSLAVLDMARPIFSEVVPFFMYLCPNLDHIDRMLRWTQKRYDVKVLQYPHWTIGTKIAAGTYMPHYAELHREVANYADVLHRFRQDTGLEWIAIGWRANDPYLIRRREILACDGVSHQTRLCYPIAFWHRGHVHTYLKAKKLPTPESYGSSDSSGVNLNANEVLVLRERYPEDYVKMKAMYPFLNAIVYRERMRQERERDHQQGGSNE